MSDNITVAIKVRPLIKRERDQKLTEQWRIQNDTIECIHPWLSNAKYSFDHICDEKTSTQTLFDNVAEKIVESAVNGFNGTIFAYGQTSSGKTHTMMGDANEPGLTVLAIRKIFEDMRHNSDRDYLLRVSYIEIYNERVYDLLKKRNELKIHEDTNGETKVNCIEKLVNSEEGIMALITEGNKERKVAETNMNTQSSRSHTIFTIIIESQDRKDEAVQLSVLNLVDLAGSERADATGATGSRLKEGSHINKSLLTLSMVINKLSEDPDQHINYRDSKLTRILSPSLGGNALTTIICTITPATVEETNYTLGFANRAKRIKNKAQVNEVLSDAVMIKRMCKQISCLESQLESERQKCRKIETDLFQHQNHIICFKEKSKVNRRRTWAPALSTQSDASSADEESKPHSAPKSHPFSNKPVFGHKVEYSEDEFNSFMEQSFSNICPTPNEFSIGKVGDRSKSLLKTPKSFRNSIPRRLTINQAGQASPIGVNKELRIERLEKEIEEFQQFQNVEFEHYQSMVKERDEKIIIMEQEVVELKARIDDELEANKLKQTELDEQIKRFNELESLYNDTFTVREKCDKELAEMQRKVSEANKAKEFAECNLVSNEVEFDIFKARSKKREEELIEQLNSIQSDDVTAQLKERNKQLTENLKTVEVSFWDAESKLKLSIHSKDEEIAELKKANETMKAKFAKSDDELQKLRSEYDEISMQIMDNVQENDELKSKTKSFETKIDELNQLNEKLSQEIKIMSESMRISEETIRSIQEQNDSSERNSPIKIANDENAEKIEILQIELEKCKTENIDLVKQNEVLMKDIESLTKSLQEMQTELSKLTNSLSDEQKRVEDLQQQNNDINMEIDVAKPDFEKLKSNHIDLSKRYTEMANGFVAFTILTNYFREKSAQNENRCNELIREKMTIQDICNQSRITVQFTFNEMKKLRKSYEDLQMYFASQELENMKLHKTICESSMNVTSIIDDNQIKTLETKIDQLTAESSTYSAELRSLSQCLEDLEDDSSDQTDENETILVKKVNKLKRTMIEYNRILVILKNNDISIDQTENIENAIIESQQRHQTIKEQLQNITDEYTKSKDLCTRLEQDMKMKQTKFVQMEIKLNEHQTKMVEMEKSIIQSREECQRLQSDKKSLDEENNKLKALSLEIDQLTKAKVELEKNVQEKEQQLKEVETKSVELTEEISTLKQKLQSIESSNASEDDKIKLELAEVNQQLKSSMEAKAELESFNSKLKSQFSQEKENLEKQLSEVTQQLEIASSTTERLSANISDLNNKFDQEKTDHEKQIEKLSTENKNITMKLKEQEEELLKFVKMEQKAMELEKEFSRLKSIEQQNEKLSEEVAEKLKLIDELRASIDSAKSDNEKLRAELDQMNIQLSTNVSDVEKLVALRKQVSSLIQEKEIQNKKIEDWKRQLEEVKEIKIKLETEIEENRKVIKGLRVEADRLNTQISVFEDEEESLEKENKMILKESKQKILQMEEAQKQLDIKAFALQNKSAECERFKIELQIMRKANESLEEKVKNFDKLEKSLQTLENELKTITEGKSKLETERKNLQTQIENQKHCIEELNKDLKQSSVMEMSRKDAEIRSLTEQLHRSEELYRELYKRNAANAATPKRSSSGRSSNGNSNLDDLMKENHELKSTHERLVHELEELRTTSRQTRKSKRLSMHDDTRRISGFDWNTNECGVQTDPSSESCRCSEHIEKIAQLKREIVIMNSKYNTLKVNAGIEVAKFDNEKLKKELSQLQSSLQKERIEHQRKVDRLEEKLAKRAKITISTETQTDAVQCNGSSVDVTQEMQRTGSGFVAQMDYNTLLEKYQKVKSKLLEFKTHKDDMTKKYEEMQASSAVTRKKYESLKKLLVHRQSEIDRLEQIEAELKAQIDAANKNFNALKIKYNGLKDICRQRGVQIEKLSNTNSLIDENTSSAANR